MFPKTISPGMAKKDSEVTERILNLTIQIIYLLTGEDYTVVKKTPEDCETSNSRPHLSGEWSRARDSVMEPPPPSPIPERTKEQKILELIYKMVEILTGEVPIRCQDVAVYFSMEEWEYVEGHKDLYQDIMEDPCVLPGDSYSGYRRVDIHGPGFTKMCNRAMRFKDGASRLKKTRTVELTSGNARNLKKPEKPSLPPSSEHVQQSPSPQIKKEAVSCDGRNLNDPKLSTDHTPQYLRLQIKEEPVSCDERSLRNVDRKKNVTALYKRHLVQIKKEGPSAIEAGAPHMVEDDVNNGQMARNMENTAPLQGNPASDLKISGNRDQKCKTFICPKCNKDFLTKQLLVLHQRTHMREKPFLCSKCGKSFSKISHYIRHQSVHIGVKPYTCPDCGKSFSDRSYLSRHQRMHADLISKPFKCPECEVRFMNQYELVAHCKVHAGKKPFACPECGKRFTRNYQLLKHEKVHTGDVPFLCTECGTCFRNNALLVKHQQYHSKEKQFSCPECGKSFSDRSHFVRHVRIHTGEKPFMCSECGRRFNDKSSLSRHHRLHTGEKPYACPDCGQSFRYSSTLIKHQEIHRISKPFKCPECDTYFMSNAELLIHRSVHSVGT